MKDSEKKFIKILEKEGIKLNKIEIESDRITVSFNTEYNKKYKNLIVYAANAAGIFSNNFYIIEKALLFENVLKNIQVCSF